MGSLVFQATLGGQVNLNGPNTASTFDIAVPATTGTMVTTGDSGTVTNTMLAASAYNTPGTIGSGTANTGAFTTLSASSTVSGTGFSTYLASPPAIGGTTAASGRFSSLTNTGLTSGRVVYSTTGGLETDSANLLYSGTDLTVYGITVGRGAGAVATSTVVGANSMSVNTGANNTAVGYQAAYNHTSGTYNTALGSQAMSGGGAGITGSSNVGVGPLSLGNVSSGSNNVAIGRSALEANTTASNNTAVGYQAGYTYALAGGLGMTAMGYKAGFAFAGSASESGGSVFIGTNSGITTSTGYDNTAIGAYSLRRNTTGNNNNAMGVFTMEANTTGSNNTAIGHNALTVNTTGTYNTVIGSNSGGAITTGSKNVIIGSYTGSAAPISATGSNYIVLSDGDGNVRQTIDSSGNVGIGTTSPTTGYRLDVSGAIRTTSNLYRSNYGTIASGTSGNGFARYQGYFVGATNHDIASLSVGYDAYAATFDTAQGQASAIQCYGCDAAPSIRFYTGQLAANFLERMRIDNVGNMQMQTGAVMPYAPAPAAISAAATLSNANIQGQIISATGTTYTITMPLGTTLDTLATWTAVNTAYDFFVINTATGVITMAVNTGVTSLGSLTIAIGASAHFRIRRTAASTYVLYRLV